jgi:hypothetical protein
MAEQTNAEMVRSGYETFAKGGMEIEGKAYSIELCPTHANQYQARMQEYLGRAAAQPKVIGTRTPAKGGASVSPGLTGPANTATVRAWARRHGYRVNARGRMSADIVSAYEALQQRSS